MLLYCSIALLLYSIIRSYYIITLVLCSIIFLLLFYTSTARSCRYMILWLDDSTRWFYSSRFIFGYSLLQVLYYSLLLLFYYSILLYFFHYFTLLLYSSILIFMYRVGGETVYMRIFALPPIVAPHRIACRASERDPFCAMFVSRRRLQFRAFAIPFLRLTR